MDELNKDVALSAAAVADEKDPLNNGAACPDDGAASRPVTATFGNIVRGWWLSTLVWCGIGVSMATLSLVGYVYTPVLEGEVSTLIRHAQGIRAISSAYLGACYYVVTMVIAGLSFLGVMMSLSHLMLLLPRWRKGCRDCGFAGAQHDLQYWGNDMASGKSKGLKMGVCLLAILGGFYHLSLLAVLVVLQLVFVLASRYDAHVSKALGGFIANKRYDCERCEPYDEDDYL